MPAPFDRPAFETLFHGEYKGLCFWAVSYVKNMETAEEIVQESFVGLWEHRERVDMDKPVRLYLSAIVRNKCLNYLRNNRKFNTDMLALDHLMNEQYPGTSDPVIFSELKKNIHDAILELPEKCREVFLLSRNEHLRYQEIADRLRISVKTVETQMSKALQRLRERLSEYLTALLIFCMINF